MTPNDIRIALQSAIGVPQEAMRAAMQQSVNLAPAVIEVAQSMIAGWLPFLHQEKLLRFGVHALAAARETTSLCLAFLALLRRPRIEVGSLFGEDRETLVARVLLGLFDGDEPAVLDVVADTSVDAGAGEAFVGGPRFAPRTAGAARSVRRPGFGAGQQFRVVWWAGSHSVTRRGRPYRARAGGWQAGRLNDTFWEIDRQDLLEQVRAEAEQPENPERFQVQQLISLDDPEESPGRSADAPRGPDDALGEDELAWLDLALMRTTPENDRSNGPTAC